MFSKDSNILIAEDSTAVRTLLKRQFSSLGYLHIFEAEDGIEALECLNALHDQGKNIHLVVCDWNMPRLSGLDLLILLRTDQKFNALPFLMITYESDIALVTLAIAKGADDYIVKPVTEEILQEKLDFIWKKITQVKSS